jgi:hypothetical protein
MRRVRAAGVLLGVLAFLAVTSGAGKPLKTYHNHSYVNEHCAVSVHVGVLLTVPCASSTSMEC